MKALYPFVVSILLVIVVTIPANCQSLVDNQKVILNETTRLLEGSIIFRNLDEAFTLESNLPVHLRRELIHTLLAMGKQVMIEPSGGHKVNIEVHAKNTFTRLNRRHGERFISGEVILYQSHQNIINKTETFFFSYIDTVAVKDKTDLLSGNWVAANFHEVKDGRRRSLVKRVGEPLVIIGASAVTIFLLYNVRR